MLSSFWHWLADTILALGYPGIVLLMAIESSVLPLPSELVMPPAGYLAAKGQMNGSGRRRRNFRQRARRVSQLRAGSLRGGAAPEQVGSMCSSPRVRSIAPRFLPAPR